MPTDMNHDMREKIEAIVLDAMTNLHLISEKDVADAIIAALPGMVQELEWTWHKPPSVWRATTAPGQYEVDTYGSWTLMKGGVFGRVHDGGKPAANAHHRAQVLAAFGIAPAGIAQEGEE